MHAIAPAPRRGLPVLAWIGIGCGGLVGLAILAVVAGIALLALTAVRAACPPPDLPVPPGSAVAGVHEFSGTGGSSCDVAWESTQDLASTSAYYEQALQDGDWRTTATDSGSGTTTFHRASRSSVTGQIRLLGHGSQTRIEVHLDSSDGRFGR